MPFVKLDETLKHTGQVVSLHEASFRAPDGELMTREIVRHPGAVSVVAVVDEAFVLVRQYRAPIEAEILEIPAGKRDIDGEAPEVTAARELEEEVGLAAGALSLLCEFHNTPGFCDEYSYCFLATDCTPVPDNRQGPEERHMTIEHIPIDAALAAITDGTITDGKTIIGLLMALQRLA